MSGYIGNIPTPQATQTRDVFTATAGQTSFATSGYTPGFLDVYLNGVHLVNGTDYTASNGSDVVLSSGATAGDNVEVVAYTTFQTGDFVPTSGGTFAGNVAVNGNLTVDTDTLFVDAASNNVGIGLSSPNDVLNLYKASRPYLVVQNATTGTSVADGFWLGYDSSNLDVQIRNKENAGLLFFSNDLERARIDASGNLLVGTTVAAGNKTHIAFDPASQNGMRFSHSSGTYTNSAIVFVNHVGSTVGGIKTNGTTTAYNISSDYRLKENVVPLAGAADRLAQIPVHRFNFIADPDTTVDGFLAHEVQAFVPEAVTGTKDEVDDEGNPKYQGIDQSKLVPLLTAALQEALADIATLKAEVAALKGEPA